MKIKIWEKIKFSICFYFWKHRIFSNFFLGKTWIVPKPNFRPIFGALISTPSLPGGTKCNCNQREFEPFSSSTSRTLRRRLAHNSNSDVGRHEGDVCQDVTLSLFFEANSYLLFLGPRFVFFGDELRTHEIEEEIIFSLTESNGHDHFICKISLTIHNKESYYVWALLCSRL